MTVVNINSERFLLIQPLGKKYDSLEDISQVIKFIVDYNPTTLLKGLILTGNSYSSTAILGLVQVLLEKSNDFCSEIRYLDFSDMFTGRLKDDVPRSLEALGRLMQQCPSLESLNLSDNAFGPAGATAISPFLKNISLRSLLINNNGLGQLGSSIIAKSLKSMKNLSIFSIGRNRLEDPGACSIAEVIKTTFASSLTQFSIFQNGITKKGILALCDALSMCTNLDILDLQDNTFTEEAAVEFSKKVIPSIAPVIRILSLNDCLLSRKGSKAILEKMLCSEPLFPNLAVLGLQYNGIGLFEISLLTQLVSSTPHLQSLQLNGNTFDPEDSAFVLLQDTLMRMNQENVIDSLSDMESEVEESESEGSDAEDLKSHEFKQESPDSRELAEILENIHV